MACSAATVITGMAPAIASSTTASAAPPPAASSTVNWPGFHDNAEDTGYNSHETTIGPGNVAGLSQGWLAGHGRFGRGRVAAYSAATGRRDWSLTLPDDGAGTEPVYANGLVYVAGYFSMNAYNAATGAAVWHVSLNGLVRSVPAVSNGRLFLATECCAEPRPRANFLVLDASTGTVLWSKRVGSDLGFQQASPVVHVDMVY